MKFATVGTSEITNKFLEAAGTIPDLQHTAVYSRSYENGLKFATSHHIHSVFTDLTLMATSNEFEAVYIASPNSMHYEQSKLFLENGKHVLCEKSITVAPNQIKELRKLAKQKNLIYMEAIIMLHLPARQRLKAALSEIGTITSARFDYSHLSSRYPAYLAGEMPNIFNPTLAAGCLMDLGVYCVYPAIDLFGVPDQILATAGFLKTGCDGYGSSIFIYKDKQVLLTYSKVGTSHIGSEIVGDKGTITIDTIARLTNIKLSRNDGSKETIFSGSGDSKVFMAGEALDFYRYITDPLTYQEEYIYAGELAENVSQALETIRELTGIQFQ